MKIRNDDRLSKDGWKLLAGAVLKRAILDGNPEFIDTEYGQNLLELAGLKITDFSSVINKGYNAKELNLQRAKLRYYRKIGNKQKEDQVLDRIQELKKLIENNQ